MTVCSAMLSASLLERRLAYSATCFVRVLLAVSRLVTATRSYAVTCSILANATDIYVTLFAVPACNPPYQEVCCCSRRLACASMKCAWNDVQVFSCSNLVRQVRQSS